MTMAVIAFGANVGDPRATYRELVEVLRCDRKLARVRPSRLYRTKSVGGPPRQSDYLNAAIAVETDLDAAALHRRLGELERHFGRNRRAHWDARTIDLDLALFGDRVIDTPDLVVPHPRMHFRRFVLAPVAELTPDVVHPVIRKSSAELLAMVVRAHQSPSAFIRVLGDIASPGTVIPSSAVAASRALTLGGRVVSLDVNNAAAAAFDLADAFLVLADGSQLHSSQDQLSVRIAIVDVGPDGETTSADHVKHFGESLQPVVAVEDFEPIR